MSILEAIRQFSKCYRKEISVHGTPWHYYVLGTGAPVLWLTGGMRRAAIGFSFMERLATHYKVIAPDYPPVQTIDDYLAAFDAILAAEGEDQLTLVGQSYGGMLAQAYLAHRPKDIQRLVLSSSGPADYGKGWLPVESAIILLVRLLPEQWVKNVFTSGLLKVVTLPEKEREEWVEAIQTLMREDITRADVISHFAVVSDLIRTALITPGCFQNWAGNIFVLRAENDITQSEKDFPRYERIYGRPATVIDMGKMGHTAAMFNPARFAELLERALA